MAKRPRPAPVTQSKLEKAIAKMIAKSREKRKRRRAR